MFFILFNDLAVKRYSNALPWFQIEGELITKFVARSKNETMLLTDVQSTADCRTGIAQRK